MQVETNHLISGDEMEKLSKFIEDHEYEQLPEELQLAASLKLKGKDSAFISKTSGGKLSKYAAKRRRRKLRGKK
ncbi:hypothetical protein LCGC14_1126910 [marine sediment metagenome]|uniref:Uncharacterized protein n=1 Tax=marine sediment metagenome TaxID=412755 RepID=A0A0F9Q832_9ZZZZ